jgi:SAM-dependent methyltransferase
MVKKNNPPVCDYEGSDYQNRFWDKGGREYEDRCEGIAMKRLLPPSGSLLLELGAGAGRNTQRYQGFERVVLLDYSRTQLMLAQERLGRSDRYIYVAADIYKLPFAGNLFDCATMIRTLHHMADAPAALRQVANVLQPGATLILEYANKQNVKAIMRYLLHRQTWSPFSLEPIEFAPLNFDFHPKTVKAWLHDIGLQVEKILAVSYFRLDLLKRIIPINLLTSLDSILQYTGTVIQLSPSIFLRARNHGELAAIPQNQKSLQSYFKCPECGHSPLSFLKTRITCPVCTRGWNIKDGIIDFRGSK